MLIQESQIQVLGFDFLKELYEKDVGFKEALKHARIMSCWKEVSGWIISCRKVCYLRKVSYAYQIVL